MRTVDRDPGALAYAYDRALVPSAIVAAGETVAVRTADARAGALLDRPIGSAFDLPSATPGRANPLTGPIAIEGARPGDRLVVTVERIDLDPLGWCGAFADVGPVAPGRIPAARGRVHRTDGEGPITVADGIAVPRTPMIGCLGTAPADAAPSSLAAGAWGGNMDHRPVTTGARVHLPVAVEAALLFVGDVHAAMGDGELSGLGLETPATVTLTVDVLPGAAPAWPWLENAERVMVLTAAPTFEAARDAAVAAALDAVEAQLGAAPADALALLSLAADLRIGQAFGAPEVTVRLELPADLGVRPR